MPTTMRMVGRMTLFPCFCSCAIVAVVSVEAAEAVVSVGDVVVAVALTGAEAVVSVAVGEPASGEDEAVPGELAPDGSAIGDCAALDEAGSAAVFGASAGFVS
jgi:hypothetical protein